MSDTLKFKNKLQKRQLSKTNWSMIPIYKRMPKVGNESTTILIRNQIWVIIVRDSKSF